MSLTFSYRDLRIKDGQEEAYIDLVYTIKPKSYETFTVSHVEGYSVTQDLE